MYGKLATIIAGCVVLTACQGTPDAPAHRIAAPAPHTSSGIPSPVAAGPGRTVIRDGHAFPDRKLTPGDAVSSATAARVCSPEWNTAPHTIPIDTEKLVFFRYGIPYTARGAYQLDHLIPVELGGSDSDINLWPQILTDNDGTGPSKDALEVHLRALVCAGRLDLMTAQRGIAANWLRMWDDYEHVPVPD